MTRTISHTRAIVYTLLGYTIYVFGDTCTKLSGKAHLPVSQIIVFASFFSMLTLATVMAARKQTHLLVPHQWKKETFRSLLYVVISFLNVMAFTRFPLATVYAVLFTVPLWTSLASAVFLREALPWRLGLAILAGFGGVFLALQPQNMNFQNAGLTDSTILVLFPVLVSIHLVLIRFLSRKEHSESMVFCTQAVRFLAVLPLCLWQFQPMTLTNWLTVAGLGFFGALGSLPAMAALKHAPAAMVTPFTYSQIISGALIGYLIWNDIPSPQLVAGSIVIFLSGLYIARHARRIDARVVSAV